MALTLQLNTAAGPHLVPGNTVVAVAPGSTGQALGIRTGDRVLALNGHPLQDIIDYRFYVATERVSIDLERDGVRLTITADKHPDDTLGLAFSGALFDDIIRCNNQCYFCFVGGNRRGMRRSLFVKDDDYRLSFLFGNFATLTNLTEADWERIARQRLSPLHVSVHATEPDLRRKLLANPNAPDILEQIDRLISLRISLHCQLVICPGLNDGEHLDRSIRDLAARAPWVQTIAVVPVGLTDANQVRGAHKLRVPDLSHQVCTPDAARALLRQVEPYRRTFARTLGTALVYPSDEYYLIAGEAPPSARSYNGYPQYENGVGMVRSLLEDWRRVRRRLADPGPRLQPVAGNLTLVSGTLIAPVLGPMLAEAAMLTGSRFDYVPAPNRTFGASVNCSGLLGGRDILAALAGRELGTAVVLPRYSLDEDASLFIDDLTPEDLERELGRPILFAETVADLFTRRTADDTTGGPSRIPACGVLMHSRGAPPAAGNAPPRR